MVPLVANEPLAVAALSYAGALTFGIAADRDAFPDLEVFATAMREGAGSARHQHDRGTRRDIQGGRSRW